MPGIAIIVPLKSFATAKSRLRESGIDASAVAASLAEGVLAATAAFDRFVVGESDDVLAFATTHGASPLRSPRSGLNEAVQFAAEFLRADYDWLAVAHGDLLWPEQLDTLATVGQGFLVTDHHGTGTNVLVVPTHSPYTFAFGPDSRQRHQAEFERRGIPFTEVSEGPLTRDVDEVTDLPQQD